MFLFVGLGNPGAQYARNRHNIGFMAVDAIADRHGFSPWRSKFQGQVSEGRLGTEKVVLLKPETFMNLSGDSVQAAAQFFKLEPGAVTVFHDELDLAPGRVRVKAGGGHAGHNGLRSITAHLGPEFVRVRIGIGHPGDKRLVSSYVLGDFAKSDEDWLKPLLDALAHASPELVSGQHARFTSLLADGAQPQKPKAAAPGAEALAPVRAGKAAVSNETEVEPKDDRSALQRLVDRFR